MKKLRKIFIISILFIILHSSFIFSTHAASPSPTTKESTQSSGLVQKLEELKKEIASKAADIKKEINKKLQNRAYSGVVIDKIDSQITVQDEKEIKKIKIDEYTTYQDDKSTKKKQILLKDIVKDDFIIALGDVDDNNVLSAKKIVKTNPPKLAEKKFLWGQVQSIPAGTINIKTKDGTIMAVSTSGNTQFSVGNEEGSLADVKGGRYVAITANGNNVASFVYIITKGAALKIEKKETTPSATPKAKTR